MKRLYSHPYIAYKLAKLIVKYREHHGLYNNLEDLKKMPLIDDQLFRKIVVYLVIE
jgi:DNA uptake protein ComE-like DNA-binding protein